MMIGQRIGERTHAGRWSAALKAARIGHRGAVRAIEILAMVGLAGMGAVVLLGVLDRYLLGLGYYWTEEAARFLLIWCSFLGASIAVERKGHFVVNFFSDRFFWGWKLWALNAFVGLCSVVALVVLVITGYELAVSARDQLSPALRIPMSWIFVAVPVNGALMLYFALVRAITQLFSPGR